MYLYILHLHCKKIQSSSWTLLDPFFLILEKPIADRGNTTQKGFFLSSSYRIFSPKRLSRKFRVRFLVRESHQDLG
jgi:hypothetical protein